MKKQNETKMNETTMKPKKERATRKFFLYVEGKGMIAMSNDTPTFNDGELIWFNTKSKAMFAKDFFVKMKLAENIDILTKVA